jgi:hypothetical protein
MRVVVWSRHRLRLMLSFGRFNSLEVVLSGDQLASFQASAQKVLFKSGERPAAQQRRSQWFAAWPENFPEQLNLHKT